MTPDQELVEQLIMMGFPAELCKKALIKVKNESLQIAADALMELQEQAIKATQATQATAKLVKAVGNQKILSYSCTVCTLINKEGSPMCEACGTLAPASAIMFEKSEEELLKEKAEEERRVKEEI